MKTVGNYPDLASAQVAQSLLEAAGIPALIPDQFLAVESRFLCAACGHRWR